MPKVTLQTLNALKHKGEPFTVLTAYDATFTQLLNDCGVEVILIGDSLGMVIQGHESTVPVTMEQMNYHVRCVATANSSALLIADLPYMSYATKEQALHNAAELMRAGANMVKLEGGQWLTQTVKALSDCGVPVCAEQPS